MIDTKRLLDDLKRLLRRLEDDLRERSRTDDAMHDILQREYQAAREAGRTGEAFEVWREGMLTQAAVAWLLGCVFVRFMEDNGLVDEPLLSGSHERRQQAAERQMHYFRQRPTDSDRDYLYDVFRTVAQLPAVTTLLDTQHHPVWLYGISGDAAKELIGFWRQVVPETGELLHDFIDLTWNTRFLGNLYQDLFEDARKRYALLQTPEFVESFILDRTLEPAIETFGLKAVRLIDPTCGSGHFLLGAFRRLLDRWFRIEPGTVERELVQRALDAVVGVDVNPYAVAIARFRLLVAALQASGITKLREAPGFRINVAAGDSLLHGRRFEELGLQGEVASGVGPTLIRHRWQGMEHAYRVEDLAELNRLLGQQYHVVVGNPPYITVKDRGLNQAYRDRYSTCHRKYSLGVPFTERFFDLAFYGYGTQPAGYVGMITANSFMKREFGKKLIEEFFPHVDLTHVIDTSGAYIPGHRTPTVILLGRHRTPVNHEVRAVLGIRGEPSTPEEAAQGKVWRSIAERDGLRKKMARWQEELDWLCYGLYGLITSESSARSRIWSQACEDMATLEPDERPYRMFAHRTDTSQLDPVDQSRCELISYDQCIGLIERPEYKRRWFRSAGAYDSNNLDDKTLLQRAIRGWLLDRLEGASYWREPYLQTTQALANLAQLDADFMQVAECYRGHAGFDVHALVAELVEAESVPFLPILRYKPSGLRQRDIWEQTWAKQRREDAIDAEVAASLTRREDETEAQYQTRLSDAQRRRKQDEIGDIPPPPKIAPPTSSTPLTGACGAHSTCPKSGLSAIPFAPAMRTRRC